MARGVGGAREARGTLTWREGPSCPARCGSASRPVAPFRDHPGRPPNTWGGGGGLISKL